MMKKRWILLIILAGLTLTLYAGQLEKKKEPLSIADRLDRLFQEWNRLDRPGGAVIVVKGGKVVFEKAYGLACMEYKIPNTTKTVFDAVAVSRPFTGMSVAILEEQGLISLDDDIRKYIPELPDFGKTITLGHLLYHTSGLWDWSKVLPLAGWLPDDVITFDHILRMVKNQKKLQFDPGKKYFFSATNYNLLAEIIKRVTGQSFREWTWTNIFRPLGMTKTLIRDRYGEPVSNQAFAYDYRPRRGYQKGGDNLCAIGSNNLFSTAEDMGKWLLNLENGKVGGSQVAKKMFTPGTLSNGKEIKYAYGWEMDTYMGLKRLSTFGQWGGFNSTILYFPEHQFGVVLLCNWTSGWVNSVYTARGIAGIYLEAFLKKPEKPSTLTKSKDIKPNPALYDQYVGDYRWEPGFVINVLQEKDQLLIQTPQNRKYQLIPLSETEFKLAVADYRFIFHKNKQGKVHQVLIQPGGGEDLIAPKIKLVKPTLKELKEFIGSYYNQELDTGYSVIIRDEKLVITHKWSRDINLTPETRDHFITDSQYYRMVEFLREKQRITGFKVKGFQITFMKI